MGKDKMFIVIVASIFITTFLTALFGIVLSLRKKKKKEEIMYATEFATVNTWVIPISFYLKLNVMLSQNSKTQKGFGIIVKRFNDINSYNEIELKVRSTQYVLLYYILPFISTLFGLFVFKDVLVGILLYGITKVVVMDAVKAAINNRYRNMLIEFSLFLSDLRQEYAKHNSVAQAFAVVVPGPTIANHTIKINNLLIDAGDKSKIDKYLRETSLRLMQTLAGVCYNCEENGDVKLKDGSSNFLQSITFISAECNQEIRKMNTIRRKFGNLKYTPLFSILILPLMSAFLVNFVMPASAAILFGRYGYILRVVVIAFALYNYTIIATVNDDVHLNSNDRALYIEKLYHKNKWFRDLVYIMKPRKEHIVKKKSNLIKESLSRWDLNYMYSEKVVNAFITFVLVTVVLLMASIIGRSYEYSNVVVRSLAVKEYDSEVVKKLQGTDKLFLDNGLSEEELHKQFAEILNIPENSIEVTNHINRLYAKQKDLMKPIYSFPMLWTALALAIIAYNLPERKLKRRSELIIESEAEDCLQLQTLIAILMETSMDTIDILSWMAITSKVHSSILIDAYHEYPMDPELALARLKFRSRSPEMKRIVTKLVSTIEDISIAEAFSDLILEREHIMREREAIFEDLIERRRVRMSAPAERTFKLIIAGVLLYPMIVLAIGQFQALETTGMF